MTWNDFIGNGGAVEQLRRLAAGPATGRTVVLAGPSGVGKTTLAMMLGLSLNCQAPPAPGEHCGACASCAQATPPDGLEELAAAALEYRTAEVKTNPRETAPLQVAPHPAVRVYPPDGDLLTMAQARALIHQSQLQPDAGQTWTLIVPDLDRARWTTQAALLKTLEEPPPGVVLVALARNPLALLPTVRSRALVVRLAPVAPAELVAALAGRELAEPELRAQLAAGCPGRALRMDLDLYRELRRDALQLLRGMRDWSRGTVGQAFLGSESARGDREKFESLVEILYSVLQDIEYLQSGFPEAIRNVDCQPELTQLAQWFNPASLPQAIEELDRIQAASGRNIFRPLALDSWVVGQGSREARGGVGA